MRTLAVTFMFALGSAYGQNPQSWRFTCDYYNLDTKGHPSGQDHITALYTRGLAGDGVRWTDVSVAHGAEPAQKRPFMEGFNYPHASVKDMTGPDFFHGFPPSAMQERNLVWDTHMFEGFVQLEHLKLNEPYHLQESADVSLAGMGTFRNKDLQLILSGTSKRNGQECALIDYRAFFNTVEVKTAEMSMTGRSHYWGQIWVSMKTKGIEYATLYEDVLGEVTIPSLAKPLTINVFRIGVFEPVQK